MATITTKYEIGDTVWFASTEITQAWHDCPDCLGSKKWEAKSPAGGVFAVPCPRCSLTYHNNDDLRLNYATAKGTARKLTIGRAEFDYDGPRYMCHETGIGSGALYREDTLFSTEEEALRSAEIRASAINQDVNFGVKKQFDRTAQFCDYQLESAAIKAAEDKERRARYAAEYLLEDIDQAENLDEVRHIMAAFRKKGDS